MSREKSLLVISKILTVVLNTFTADERYSVLTRDNLTQPIHMHISQKQKTYSEIFLLKSVLNFEHLRKKKDDPHNLCISKITDSEKHG